LHIGNGGGSIGAANLNGGVITAQFVEAGGGTATFTMGGGTLRAGGNEGNFIRGFTNSGGHSAINLVGPGGTINTNGFNVRIQAANVVASTDVLVDGLAGTVLTKAGLGTLAFEPNLGGGFISVHVVAGTFSQQGSATLDALVIDGGATYTLDALGTPPPGPAFAADAPGGSVSFSPPDFDPGSTLILTDSPSAAGVSLAPEPGSLGLLLVGALGFLGRRRRSR
jgi:hypothetical protein